MTPTPDPQTTVMAILAHLREHHKLTWIISPKDFDLLRTWSVQEIPLPRLLDALDRVVARRLKAGKPVTALSTFAYQVEKCRKSLVDERSGTHDGDSETGPSPHPGPSSDPNHFLENLPAELEPLRPVLTATLLSPSPSEADREALGKALLEHFGTLPWVEARTASFLRSLPAGFAPQTWSDRYRINLLLQHFHIPV